MGTMAPVTFISRDTGAPIRRRLNQEQKARTATMARALKSGSVQGSSSELSMRLCEKNIR
jgi:hypothetical protein